jgi:transposase InsO family protein
MRQVQQEYPALSVRTVCRWLGLSRGWYYASYAHPATDGGAAAEEMALRDAIERIVLDFPGYGYRRVTQALRRAGWGPINHKRVLRVMHEESLLCQLKRRFVVTTDAAHGYRTYPNLLKGAVLDRLDQAWVADLTYIRLPTTFVYLACILDACSRRCIGWKLSRQIDTRLTLAALEMAIERRQPRGGLIHHADRGVPYASTEYVGRWEEIGARVSMSATGNPYDNAKAESFFKTLKREEVYLKDYQTFADAEAHLGQFIEDVYNTKRLHSSLGYRPPAEFEATYTQAMLELPLPVVR